MSFPSESPSAVGGGFRNDDARGEAALRGTHSQAALGNDRDDEIGAKQSFAGTHSQAELGNDRVGDGAWERQGGLRQQLFRKVRCNL